jgi:hypothetical protein
MIKQAYNLAFFIFFLSISTHLKAQTYNIAVDKVKTVKGLAAALRSQFIDSACAFVGYTLLVMPKNGNVPFEIKSMGRGVAENDLKKILGPLQAGDTMYFSNLLIKCGSEKAIPEIKSLTLNLK